MAQGTYLDQGQIPILIHKTQCQIETLRDMIKEKALFKKVLKEWGHDIFLQRRTSDDFVYSETLERYTTRSHMPRKSALMTAKEEVPEGVFSNSDLLYYFEEEVRPKSRRQNI